MQRRRLCLMGLGQILFWSCIAFQCIWFSEDARILCVPQHCEIGVCLSTDCWIPGCCSRYESAAVHMLYYTTRRHQFSVMGHRWESVAVEGEMVLVLQHHDVACISIYVTSLIYQYISIMQILVRIKWVGVSICACGTWMDMIPNDYFLRAYLVTCLW